LIIAAIITITFALIFYSWGVWGEKIKGKLNGFFLTLFWIGLTFDSTGTFLMSKLSEIPNSFHKITGITAIVLMLIHALWGTLVFIKKDKNMINNFHKFSFFVWIIWLIPFLSGMIMGTSM